MTQSLHNLNYLIIYFFNIICVNSIFCIFELEYYFFEISYSFDCVNYQKGIYLLMVSYIFVYLPRVASSSDTSYCPTYSFPISYGTIYADNLRSVDFFLVALNDFWPSEAFRSPPTTLEK